MPFYPTTLYSLRKRNPTYTGKCLRIKRSSDSTQLDIGFASDGWMDLAALTAFVGASNGFVKTWYDQAGTANLTDAASADSIKLVSAGTVFMSNSRPMMPWDSALTSVLGTPANAALAFGTDLPFTWELFSKPSATGSGAGQATLDFRDAGSSIALLYNQSGNNPTFFDGANNGPVSGVLPNNVFFYNSVDYEGNTGPSFVLRIFKDGVSSFSLAAKHLTFVGNRPFTLGAAFNNALPWSGGIVEVRLTKNFCKDTAGFTPPDYYA